MKLLAYTKYVCVCVCKRKEKKEARNAILGVRRSKANEKGRERRSK